MSFHKLALLYAQVASAPVDIRGCLLTAIGEYSSGDVRDEVLVTIEEMNRSSVIADLIVNQGTPLTAHVVVGLEDGATGTEATVKGVCFDTMSAMAMAEAAAGEMCDSINRDLKRDMADDYHPVGLNQLKRGTIGIASPQTGCLALVEVQTTTNLFSENSCGSFYIGTQLGPRSRLPIV
ncbi:hypothetical protein YA0850_33480 [Pseudomonas veronii]|uniref:Uncharacterized protein n=1 Tax=Pseudomonas veronii TaxID=76761 RepID=A0A7Y1FCG2_PSEVE|nr:MULTISPECIES: hypothetical protein [Pseudomonas]KAA0946216.1 hypothetical protein FQ182_13610 [Pseudomonas sp. ANT_H4]KAA0947147.1 hypothetical protein FQ186_25935 [Pseudomonas sp. ANT_H14]MBI6557248.1 hypothetical protein [Pseudomonas veronii]MBI6653983.1 hypothetical protein [Pseudomonas veronii]NMY12427.1 hypothetical protein [Pseudomonas veronii]